MAVAAVLIQVCLGAVHGWSVFEKPLAAFTHWTIPETALAYTFAMASFGVGTVAGGLWLHRSGPRFVTTAAGLLYGAGYLLAGVASSRHSLLGLYLGYGVLGGLSMGAGFVCPIATLVKWFPERRGLMSGVAVLGFGGGAGRRNRAGSAVRPVILAGEISRATELRSGFFSMSDQMRGGCVKMLRKALIAIACVTVAVLVTGAGWSQAPGGAKSTVLVQSTKTFIGQDLRYPLLKPQITAVLVELPPGGSSGRHLHPVPELAYVLEGTLTLATEGQGEKVFNAGQAFVESVNTWHTGFNRGTTPLKVLAVFVGEEGTAIRINP